MLVSMIRTRFKVSAMDSPNHLWLAEHQQVVIALQIAGPVGETLTSEVLFAQTIALDHGAHAPVQNQNTFI